MKNYLSIFWIIVGTWKADGGPIGGAAKSQSRSGSKVVVRKEAVGVSVIVEFQVSCSTKPRVLKQVFGKSDIGLNPTDLLVRKYFSTPDQHAKQQSGNPRQIVPVPLEDVKLGTIVEATTDVNILGGRVELATRLVAEDGEPEDWRIFDVGKSINGAAVCSTLLEINLPRPRANENERKQLNAWERYLNHPSAGFTVFRKGGRVAELFVLSVDLARILDDTWKGSSSDVSNFVPYDPWGKKSQQNSNPVSGAPMRRDAKPHSGAYDPKKRHARLVPQGGSEVMSPVDDQSSLSLESHRESSHQTSSSKTTWKEISSASNGSKRNNSATNFGTPIVGDSSRSIPAESSEDTNLTRSMPRKSKP